MAQPSSRLVRALTESKAPEVGAVTDTSLDLGSVNPVPTFYGPGPGVKVEPTASAVSNVIPAATSPGYTSQLPPILTTNYYLSSLTNQLQLQQQILQQQQREQQDAYRVQLEDLRKKQQLAQLQAELAQREQARREQAQQDFQLRQLENHLYQSQQQQQQVATAATASAVEAQKPTAGCQPTSTLPLHSTAPDHPTQLWLLGENLLGGSGSDFSGSTGFNSGSNRNGSTTPSTNTSGTSKASRPTNIPKPGSLPAFGTYPAQTMMLGGMATQAQQINGTNGLRQETMPTAQPQKPTTQSPTPYASAPQILNGKVGKGGFYNGLFPSPQHQAQAQQTQQQLKRTRSDASVYGDLDFGLHRTQLASYKPSESHDHEETLSHDDSNNCSRHTDMHDFPKPDPDASKPVITQCDSSVACAWDGCGVELEDRSALSNHLAQTHSHTTNGEWVCFWHGCKLAQKPLPDPTAFHQHLESHLDDRPYLCKHPDCGQAFTLPSKLAAHSKTHIAEKPYHCDVQGCNKRFSEPTSLSSHSRSHAAHDKPRVCNVCGKGFSGLSNLTAHMRTHTGERPYACKYDGCGKSFTTSSDLVRHTRIHTGQKPFGCQAPGCGKRFTTSSQLNNHMRTHTGEKPYACKTPGCEKRFADLTTLRRHEQAHERKRRQERVGANQQRAGVAATHGGEMFAQKQQAQQQGGKAMGQWGNYPTHPTQQQGFPYTPSPPTTGHGYMVSPQQHYPAPAQETVGFSSNQSAAPAQLTNRGAGRGQPTGLMANPCGQPTASLTNGSRSSTVRGPQLMGPSGGFGPSTQTPQLRNSSPRGGQPMGVGGFSNDGQQMGGAVAAAHLLTALSSGNRNRPISPNESNEPLLFNGLVGQSMEMMRGGQPKRQRLEVENMGQAPGPALLPLNLSLF